MTPRSALLAVVSIVRFVAGVLAYAIALGFVALFAFEYVHAPKLSGSPLMLRVDHLLTPAVRWVSSWFGWHWPAGQSKNYAPLILAIVALFVRTMLDQFFLRADFTIRRMMKAPMRSRKNSGDARSTARQYDLSAESEQQRNVMLKRYRELEGALKSASKKTCAFLSIDVVGSTKMKVGERKTAIDATFQAYEEMVKQIFESCEVWKATWTPDGVMACFLDRELALAAVQQILRSLARFNREDNHLSTPIQIRCGLNEGDVTIFEDSALEKVADHSIDVAGHMQKYADEDTVQVSDTFYEKLQNRAGFVATGKEVDGFQTYAWKPPVDVAASQAVTPA